MRKFKDEFDPARGDVIYGRSTVRDIYQADLTTGQLDAIAGGAWVRIDDWNNSTMLYAGKQTADEKELPVKSREAAELFVKDGPPRLVDYSKALFASRYNPAAVYREPKEKLEAEMTYSDTAAIEFRMIRRACKFGIDWVVKELGTAKVHFAIDDINMADVVAKAKFPGADRTGPAVPITTSELRSLYRKWHEPAYGNHVIFYVGGNEVHAPWVADPTLWAQYGKVRYEKYRRLFDTAASTWEKLHAANKTGIKEMKKALAEAEKRYMKMIQERKYNQAVEILVDFAQKKFAAKLG